MNLSNLSWKPLVKVVAVVAAREAGVYLYKLALNKLHTEWIRAKVKDKLRAVISGFPETAPAAPPRNASLSRSPPTGSSSLLEGPDFKRNRLDSSNFHHFSTQIPFKQPLNPPYYHRGGVIFTA